jgi:hypothetical protein
MLFSGKGSWQYSRNKPDNVRPLSVSSIQERCSYCLSIHTIIRESIEFIQKTPTEDSTHLSGSGIGKRTGMRYKET